MKDFPTLQNVHIPSLLRKAETALSSRDFPAFLDAFDKIWTDIGDNPDFSGFPQEAELLHLAGEFLVHFGKAYNITNYQSRGKDLLSKAINIFNFRREPEKALNSQIVLATAYYQEGANEEYEAYLLDAERQFRGNKNHHNFLRLQLNLLIVEMPEKRLKEAKQRIVNNLIYFQQTDNLKIKTQFFIEAGIAHRRLQSFDEAYSFLTEALILAQQINNRHYEASVYNNFANTYRSDGKHGLALEFANKALNLAENQNGWRAVFLDTKALIYFDQKDYENAEVSINQAVKLFRQGDDYGGLCEALWNQTRILLQLDLREMALESFVECHQIAVERMGRESADFYLDKFSELIIFTPEGSFFEKVDSVKRQLIEKALVKGDTKITEAAKILGIDHRTLSAMMKNFPMIYDDLGIKRRTRSAVSKKFS
jgi:tetratricopeptide (TPR) repeat protein